MLGHCKLGRTKFTEIWKISVNELFYAFGYIISYFALQNESLWLLYFGYGIVGGIGLGF